MFLGPNVPSVVSIGKICQEFKSGTLTNPTGTVFFYRKKTVRNLHLEFLLTQRLID